MLGAYTFWDAKKTMIDHFRRKDHGGGAKAGWALFIIFFPIVGAVVYTIARPDTAGDYGTETGYAPRETTSTASELARLNELRTDGAISDAEFEDLKARTIAAS